TDFLYSAESRIDRKWLLLQFYIELVSVRSSKIFPHKKLYSAWPTLERSTIYYTSLEHFWLAWNMTIGRTKPIKIKRPRKRHSSSGSQGVLYSNIIIFNVSLRIGNIPGCANASGQ